jgi:hypothetical protein
MHMNLREFKKFLDSSNAQLPFSRLDTLSIEHGDGNAEEERVLEDLVKILPHTATKTAEFWSHVKNLHLTCFRPSPLVDEFVVRVIHSASDSLETLAVDMAFLPRLLVEVQLPKIRKLELYSHSRRRGEDQEEDDLSLRSSDIWNGMGDDGDVGDGAGGILAKVVRQIEQLHLLEKLDVHIAPPNTKSLIDICRFIHDALPWIPSHGIRIHVNSLFIRNDNNVGELHMALQQVIEHDSEKFTHFVFMNCIVGKKDTSFLSYFLSGLLEHDASVDGDDDLHTIIGQQLLLKKVGDRPDIFNVILTTLSESKAASKLMQGALEFMLDTPSLMTDANCLVNALSCARDYLVILRGTLVSITR